MEYSYSAPSPSHHLCFHLKHKRTDLVSFLGSLLKTCPAAHLCVCDGDFDLHARLDADGGDLLDDLRRAVEIDEALVDPHLEAIPGLGPFTTGSLPGGDAQSLKQKRQSPII